jgi:uncharacterized protein (TIGR00369 family)
MAHPRERTISWHDPRVFAESAHLSGLEMLEGIRTGKLPPPPFAELLGFRSVEVERGRVVFEMPVQEFHYSPLNIAHGGMVSALLDTVMGCALWSLLEPGMSYATTDLHVQFIRPLTIDSGVVRAEGHVVHAGRRSATSEGRAFDAKGKLVAHGTCTCMMLPSSR